MTADLFALQLLGAKYAKYFAVLSLYVVFERVPLQVAKS